MPAQRREEGKRQNCARGEQDPSFTSPQDNLDNGKSFLYADYSIQCDTAAHRAFIAYA